MRDLLPFIVTGLAVGSIYGLVATGLVLTYKTSGIFNFGYGALATVGAYAFYWLHIQLHLGWALAAGATVLVIGPLMGLVMERVAAKLAPQPVALKVVGTVGIVLLVEGLATIKYGSGTIVVPQFLPHGLDSFTLFGVVITYDRVIITVLVLAVVLGLYMFFRWSQTGLLMRAVVDDPSLLAMHGTNPTHVRRIAWIIGSSFAALSGILIVPLVGLQALLLTFLVVQAFAAAAIGGFSSIPLTLVGGLIIGVATSVAKRYGFTNVALSGLPDAIPFIVLLVVLVVRGRRLVPPSHIEARPALQYRAPGWMRVVTGIVVIIPLLLVPTFADAKLPFFITGLVTAIMILSLGLLVRMAGQVSLCHAAFAAVGAAAFSHFRVDFGIPWLLALILGALVVVPVGALVAIPAIRLSGLFLALATLGFGITLERLVYPQSWMFGILTQGREMPHPAFATDARSFYYLTLGILVVTAVSLVLVERGRLGRMLRGLADSPVAVGAMGLSTNVTLVIVFCISSFWAGVGGILLGVSRNFAAGNDPFYGSFNSLVLLATLALAPFGLPWFAIVPAAAAVIPGYIDGTHTQDWLNVLFGVSAIIVAMSGGQPTMHPRLRTWLDSLGTRARRRRPTVEQAPAASASARDSGGAGIEVRDLRVKFGGLVAVDNVSLRAPLGRVTGLIGPNGAGKTSTFDACSGFNRRFAGEVFLGGHAVTALPVPSRARRGLGRTFQAIELGNAMTVAENVGLGYEAGRAGGNPFRQLASTPGTARQTAAEVSAALELCGLSDLAGQQAGSLSTGQRRLVELARCLAGRFDVLLLDEPSAGLDSAETERFGDLLQGIVEQRGIGVLLVEHDMALVTRLCSYIYVMDFGRLIWEGRAEDVGTNDIVRSAYLGTEVLDDAGGGARVGTQ